jgi:hypothetical protein
MAMPLVVDDLIQLPGPLRAEYAKGDDGKFHLQIAGDPAKEFAPLVAANAKVAEMRTNNVALLKEKTDLTTKLAAFEGIDPAAAKAALAKTADGDEVAALKAKLTEAETIAASASAKHDQLVFKSLVSSAALAHGVRPHALDHIVSVAPFDLADGALKPKPGEKAPNIEEWLLDLSSGDAKYLFLESKGGGARGEKPTLSLGRRTDVRELLNPTPQELGKYAADIASGKAKVVITT